MEDMKESMEEKELQEEEFVPEGDEGVAQSEEEVQGNVHISEEVITELAKRALSVVEGVQAASPGLASKLGLGRKASEGVRISLDDSGSIPSINVDVYLMAKYGLRIPDLAWDVQEKVKEHLEQYTGYNVQAVNVNVQGIYFVDTFKTEKIENKAEDKSQPEPEIIEDQSEETSDVE
ncbi:MAG TPA: Asp23/Gls24 family envelope stress response protein [Synergistales bacterium]|nr:Asp23/Gls24 family envelope stress response protein [Synergistales bacterium]